MEFFRPNGKTWFNVGNVKMFKNGGWSDSTPCQLEPLDKNSNDLYLKIDSSIELENKPNLSYEVSIHGYLGPCPVLWKSEKFSAEEIKKQVFVVKNLLSFSNYNYIGIDCHNSIDGKSKQITTSNNGRLIYYVYSPLLKGISKKPVFPQCKYSVKDKFINFDLFFAGSDIDKIYYGYWIEKGANITFGDPHPHRYMTGKSGNGPKPSPEFSIQNFGKKLTNEDVSFNIDVSGKKTNSFSMYPNNGAIETENNKIKVYIWIADALGNITLKTFVVNYLQNGNFTTSFEPRFKFGKFLYSEKETEEKTPIEKIIADTGNDNPVAIDDDPDNTNVSQDEITLSEVEKYFYDQTNASGNITTYSAVLTENYNVFKIYRGNQYLGYVDWNTKRIFPILSAAKNQDVVKDEKTEPLPDEIKTTPVNKKESSVTKTVAWLTVAYYAAKFLGLPI